MPRTAALSQTAICGPRCPNPTAWGQQRLPSSVRCPRLGAPQGQGSDSARTRHRPEGARPANESTGNTRGRTDGERAPSPLLSWGRRALPSCLARDKRRPPLSLSFPTRQVGFVKGQRAWLPLSDGEPPEAALGPGDAQPVTPPAGPAPSRLPPPLAPPGPHLVQGECPHAERGQLDGVQQRDLDAAVGFCAPVGPVLVALDLHRARAQP